MQPSHKERYNLRSSDAFPKFVIMPNGNEVGNDRWQKITRGLKTLITKPEHNTVEQLVRMILWYNPTWKNTWNFDALIHVVNVQLTREKRVEFLQVTLPNMAKLALQLPKLVPKPIELLYTGRSNYHVLTKHQIASLLAHAFFCTYPKRNNPLGGDFANYPSINFNGLYCYYEGRARQTSHAKLMCLLNYFARITSKNPEGSVTFFRNHIAHKDLPRWYTSNTIVNAENLTIHLDGNIETGGKDMLQVTFANRKFGGGVLDSGSVQEEVRCIVCPEMIIARLFTEALDDNEAFTVSGIEQYCSYSGYAQTFRFEGNYVDPTKSCGGSTVVAIDALDYSQPIHTFNFSRGWVTCVAGKLEPPEHYAANDTLHVQYHPNIMNRETSKAYVGFKDTSNSTCLRPVATGNWGGGAYQGDPVLKFILQVCAVSESKRPGLHYFAFGNRELAQKLTTVVQALKKNTFTVGVLHRNLQLYSSQGKGDLYSFFLMRLKEVLPCDTVSLEVRLRPPPITPESSNYNKSFPPLPNNSESQIPSRRDQSQSLPATVACSSNQQRKTQRSAQDSSGVQAALFTSNLEKFSQTSAMPTSAPQRTCSVVKNSQLKHETTSATSRHNSPMPTPASVLPPKVDPARMAASPLLTPTKSPARMTESSPIIPSMETSTRASCGSPASSCNDGSPTCTAVEDLLSTPKSKLVQLQVDLLSETEKMKLNVKVEESQVSLSDGVLQVLSDKTCSLIRVAGVENTDITEQLMLMVPVAIVQVLSSR